jgi:sulfoxide reductase heme-binding subunit YedZ
MEWLKNNWGWILVILLAILPLANIFRMIHVDISGPFPSWFTMDSIILHGRRPWEVPREVSGARIAVKETGEWAIRWLVMVLSLTPFTLLTGIKSRLHVRQGMGITAFIYAFLHLVFFLIDKGWMETFKEVGFILGLLATLIMMVLAITSNRRSIKWLKRTWKRIHRMAYFAGILAVLHVALLKHGDWFPYLLILALGFVVRTSPVKQWIHSKRDRNPMVQVSQ